MQSLQRVVPPLEVALYQPEIPPNTGNIARLCACTGARLHLIGPLGFSLEESRLKRAGLDYWDKVFVANWASLDEARDHLGQPRMFLFSAGGGRSLWEVEFAPGDLLVFGSESVGLPDALLEAHSDSVVGVPMLPGRRSLNLATTVAVVTYEALRQLCDPDSVPAAGPVVESAP